VSGEADRVLAAVRFRGNIPAMPAFWSKSDLWRATAVTRRRIHGLPNECAWNVVYLNAYIASVGNQLEQLHGGRLQIGIHGISEDHDDEFDPKVSTWPSPISAKLL
jgi:hypothetical protein